MAEPPHGESMSPSTNSQADDSNKVKQDNGGASPPPSPKNSVAASKAKSCKGCLYYSSTLRADSRNPVCVGITRSLPGAPVHIVGQSEIEASREGRNLADFRYTCVGYSIYNIQKDQSSDGRKTQTELPLCAGLEILVDRVSSQTANSTPAPVPPPAPAPAPARTHNKEDSNGFPQRHSPKPSNSTGDEFLPRFTRNAKLVANGVAKNARRVGNQIKQCFDDILYPYQRPPKLHNLFCTSGTCLKCCKFHACGGYVETGSLVLQFKFQMFWLDKANNFDFAPPICCQLQKEKMETEAEIRVMREVLYQLQKERE